jgi:hypothetical protein
MAEQSEKKRSVFKMLTDKQVDLFHLLSARSWDEKDPHMNSEARRLTANRDTALIYNNVKDWMSDEKGDVYKEGLIGFLTNGYSHDEQPGGFTCLFIHPKEYDDTTQEERFQFLRGVLGSSEATDEMIKNFAKQRWFLPSRIEQAEIQLESTAKFLDMMTRRRGIASAGYWKGLKLLQSNRRSFARELRRNNLFLVEFSHYLDLVFQAFCSRLLEYRSEKQPVSKARRRLEFFMEDKIGRTFDCLEMGIVPKLTLPKALLGRTPSMKTPDSDSEAGPKRQKKKRDDLTPQEWWKVNPGPVAAWAIPDGKAFGDFWNASNDTGKANIARLPKVAHHINRGSKQSLCAKYQTVGACTARCPYAHCNANRLSPSDKALADDAFKKAHKT